MINVYYDFGNFMYFMYFQSVSLTICVRPLLVTVIKWPRQLAYKEKRCPVSQVPLHCLSFLLLQGCDKAAQHGKQLVVDQAAQLMGAEKWKRKRRGGGQCPTGVSQTDYVIATRLYFKVVLNHSLASKTWADTRVFGALYVNECSMSSQVLT